MSVNILSVPMFMGGASHQIPLFMLHQKHLKKVDALKNYFLLPKRVHSSFMGKNIEVLPIDYGMNVTDSTIIKKEFLTNFLKMEKNAYDMAKPDLIIEDSSFSSPLIAEKNGIPRISIQRTGVFRSIEHSKRNTSHKHSLETKGSIAFLNPVNKYSTKKTDEKSAQELLLDYLHPKTKIIPGIPLIEKLPDDIANRDSFFYSGPLNLADNLSDKAFIENINAFVDKNKNRTKVFISTGLINKQDISQIIKLLLENNYAVISTNSYAPDEKYKSQLLVNSFFPLNFTCSKVDLIIHHCGSGMYHYPILNEKPVITLGTQSYDREDVALRLEELGVSKHVPSSADNSGFLEIFEQKIRNFETEKLCDFKKLKELKNQIIETSNSFNPRKIIEYTLNKN